MHHYRGLVVVLLLLLMPTAAAAIQFHVSHSDPIAPVILGVTGILFVALIGRFSARKLGLPSVLGELLMGILLGNLAYYFSFDLIIAPFRVIMHLLDKEDQIRALNNVCKHLNKNGRFIFDAFVPNLEQLIQGLDDVTDFDEEYEKGKRIKRTVTTSPDLIKQIINIRFKFEWDEGNGKKQEE